MRGEASFFLYILLYNKELLPHPVVEVSKVKAVIICVKASLHC